MALNDNVDAKLSDPETKREEFSKAVFNTLAPAVRQCDEVVRGVFQSQNKVLTEISNLEQILNQWKQEDQKRKSEKTEKQQKFEQYVKKLEYVRGKVDNTSNQLNVIHKRLNDMKELIRKKSENKSELW
eukprot:209928_1